MNKAIGWIGAALIALGVVLGFVKSGECGSVFQPRDEFTAGVNKLLGQDVADCSTAVNLAPVVWGLIVVGVVLVIVGILRTLNDKGGTGDADTDQPAADADQPNG